MPAQYKYIHITVGRKRALELALAQHSELFSELTKSGALAKPTLERMRHVNVLLTRAAHGLVAGQQEIQLLDELLGPEMGEQYTTPEKPPR